MQNLTRVFFGKIMKIRSGNQYHSASLLSHKPGEWGGGGLTVFVFVFVCVFVFVFRFVFLS